MAVLTCEAKEEQNLQIPGQTVSQRHAGSLRTSDKLLSVDLHLCLSVSKISIPMNLRGLGKNSLNTKTPLRRRPCRTADLSRTGRYVCFASGVA
jgi:hypothetical protein